MKRDLGRTTRYGVTFLVLLVGMLLTLASPPPDGNGNGNGHGSKASGVYMQLRSSRANNIDRWNGTVHWVGQYLDRDTGGPGSASSFDVGMDYDQAPELINGKWHSTMSFWKTGLRPGKWQFSYYIVNGTAAACLGGIALAPGETVHVNFTQGRPGCGTGLDFP